VRGPRVLVGLGLIVVLGGCGIPPTDPLPFGEPAKGAEIGDQMYFLLDGKIFPTLRNQRTRDPDAVIEALAAGPLPAELAAGLTTEVPADLQIGGAKPAADTGSDLNLFVSPDPTGLSDLAVTQITCTAITAYRRFGSAVERLVLIDRTGHRRGPSSCALLKRPGDQ
jgi:hypothetical protein